MIAKKEKEEGMDRKDYNALALALCRAGYDVVFIEKGTTAFIGRKGELEAVEIIVLKITKRPKG
jgi:hypothetical protein